MAKENVTGNRRGGEGLEPETLDRTCVSACGGKIVNSKLDAQKSSRLGHFRVLGLKESLKDYLFVSEGRSVSWN